MSIVSIRQLINKVYTNMFNLFTMELNIIVCNVTIRQLRNKVFNNMCDLFILEFTMFVRNVVIRQLRNKTFNNMSNLLTNELYKCEHCEVLWGTVLCTTISIYPESLKGLFIYSKQSMFYIFRSASEAIWETTLFSDIVLGLRPNIQILMFTIGYVNKCSKNRKRLLYNVVG